MQTIGERLEEARKKKGISIREAAEATKIRGDYLQKFESNQFDIGLTEIYTRGFLRNYSNFLKLPADRILNDYASLGRGDIKPRQPSREIYGRMDITVATAGESSDRAAPPEAGAATPAAGTGPTQPRYPRGSGPTLPSGPDPATVFKYVKWGGIALVVLVAALVIKALFTGRTPPAPTPAPRSANPASNPTAPMAPSANDRGYALIGRDAVFVQVNKLDGENGNGELIYSGTLKRGERVPLVWNEPVKITASAGENVDIEWNGQIWHVSTMFTGFGSARLVNPPNRGR